MVGERPRRRRADPPSDRGPRAASPRPLRRGRRGTERADRSLLPPRRDLRHDRRRHRQRRGHSKRVRLANAIEGGLLSPRLLDRRGRPLQGRPRGQYRRGPESRPSCSTGPSSRRRRSPTVPWRVYRGDRRRQLAHRRDGQDRRSVFTAIMSYYLPGRFPWAELWLYQHRARRLRRRVDGSHRRSRARRPGVPSDQPQSALRRRATNTIAAAAHAPQRLCASTPSCSTRCPRRTLSMLMQLRRRERAVGRAGRLRHPRRGAQLRRADGAVRHPRHRADARGGSGIVPPPADSYATKLWDYWERNLDPDLFKDRSFEGAVNGKTARLPWPRAGSASGGVQDRPSGGLPLLVARRPTSSRRPGRRSEHGRHGLRVFGRHLRPGLGRCVVDHVLAVDVYADQQRRCSIRRSIALSYDRFHDFERRSRAQLPGHDRRSWSAAAHAGSAAAV